MRTEVGNAQPTRPNDLARLTRVVASCNPNLQRNNAALESSIAVRENGRNITLVIGGGKVKRLKETNRKQPNTLALSERDCTGTRLRREAQMYVIIRDSQTKWSAAGWPTPPSLGGKLEFEKFLQINVIARKIYMNICD